jgi:hypothetical protein
MNEKIQDTFGKWKPDKVEAINKIVDGLIKEYNDQGIEIKLEIDFDNVIYTQKDGSRYKFPRWEKVLIKNNDKITNNTKEVKLEERIREIIENDLNRFKHDSTVTEERVENQKNP